MAVPRTSISGFLARSRALLYRHEARRAALYAIAAILALALVTPLAGNVYGGSRATAFALLGTAGLLATCFLIAAFVVGGVVPRRRFDADHDLARWVGTQRPAVASDLLSAVELRAAPPRPGAPSAALVDALVDSTGERLAEIDPAGLLAVGEMRRGRRLALLAAAANVVALVVMPHAIAEGWARLLSAPPKPFDGAKLSVVPLVGDLEATLTFPAYSKRPPLKLPSSSGDVRGLPGTTVALRARVLVPAAAATLVIDAVDHTAGAAPRTIVAKLDGDQLTAELTIDHSSRYRFELTSATGEHSIETTPRAIEAEPDQAPTVQLLAPADVLDVSNLRRVELAYVIEDDFGLTSAELVWESGKDRGKKPITLDGTAPPSGGADGRGQAPAAEGPGSRAQGKILWDLAELQVPSGGDVRYWVEAKDNDSVGGPNIGRSRELHLRVISPRERHEETLARQQAVAEKLLHQLGVRLVPPTTGLEDSVRDDLAKELREAVVELGSIGAAFEKDPHASDALRKVLAGVRDRLDKAEQAEARALKAKGAGRFAALDPRMIAELEDDMLVLADWLDRERLEGLLDLSDEIAAHQKRLHELLAEFARTKDPRLLDEIERELRALDRAYAELEKHRQNMPEDVLDQFVHRDALTAKNETSCIDEVRKLVQAGQSAAAQVKLEQCQAMHERGAAGLEGSLAGLRGDRFSDEQKKLDEVMNELADVAKDQDDIAAESDRIFKAYAEKADEVAKDHRREASKRVAGLLDKLRKRINEIPEAGLTPFAKEELDVVERRLADVEHMVADGDLAEALGMATQAKQSLDTIAGELEAALNDDPKSKWADATQDALDGVERATPAAKELIAELQALSPRPDQIMSDDDKRALERLRRREGMTKERARKLSDRTKQLGGELPGDASAELGKKLGTAVDQMGMADDRMKGKDPSGTREATRSAADALAKARDRARSAARQAQQGLPGGEEPIRIPGADEYHAPERFREDLLEAMKKSAQVPEGYAKMIKRYYEELIR